MHETHTITPEQRAERDRIRRRDLLNSLLIGVVLGALLIGGPLGWFAHRFYAQQQVARVLLCRRQNADLTEAALREQCGPLY